MDLIYKIVIKGVFSRSQPASLLQIPFSGGVSPNKWQKQYTVVTGTITKSFLSNSCFKATIDRKFVYKNKR